MRSFVVPGTDKILFNNNLQGHNLLADWNDASMEKASQLSGYMDQRAHGGRMNRLKIDLRNVDLADNEIWIESLVDACPVFHVSIDGYCYPRTRFGYLKSFDINNDRSKSHRTIEMAPEFQFNFGLKLAAKEEFSEKTILVAEIFEDTVFTINLEVTGAGELVTLSIDNSTEKVNTNMNGSDNQSENGSDHGFSHGAGHNSDHSSNHSSDLTSNNSSDDDSGDEDDNTDDDDSDNDDDDDEKGDDDRKRRETHLETVPIISTFDVPNSAFEKISNQSLRIFNSWERLDTSLATKVQFYSLSLRKAEIDVQFGANNFLYDVSVGFNGMVLSEFLWASPKAIGLF